MNILVTGSDGQLGFEIKRASLFDGSNSYYSFTDIEQLNITDKPALEQFINEFRPDVVMNFAAYTAVDKAETEKDAAFAVNTTAVEYLAELSGKYNFFLLHISTDYVFDGKSHSPITENHPMAPESYYGLTKASGEAQMRKICQRGAIIRTSWLYSSFGNNFVKTILKHAAEKEELKVVDDQFGTPTYTADLIQFVFQHLEDMLKVDGVETYHCSNSGVATWYDFACAIVELSSLSCRILPIPTEEYPTAAPRPAYSVMSKQKIKEKFNYTPRHWRAALEDCLKEIK
ncbi:MAG: dTDP-4-dehydrorhamnose reductase [Bacteroidales bacterium]|nr:dTDP-4-dehydrorhamnose reductase [Bacteroidales bacterium]